MSINILDELYNDLFHMTKVEDTDGTYKAALDKLVKAEEERRVYRHHKNKKSPRERSNFHSRSWIC